MLAKCDQIKAFDEPDPNPNPNPNWIKALDEPAKPYHSRGKTGCITPVLEGHSVAQGGIPGQDANVRL